jgi:peptidoglycan/LPS O-acetylase OafA/YrhL
MKSNSPRYRFDINGLRAIAVFAVILNHLDREYLPSGFLGVDIFFVISGFVITSSLQSLPQHNFGAFFVSFFARRIRRLLPALLVCVLLTSAAICFVDPAPLASLKTGALAIVGLSNFFLLISSTDYFARAAEANAFTQTWSLGVEEQYYLIFPALVWGTHFLRSNEGSRRLLRLIAVLSIASLATYLALSRTNANAAFYLMPLRFWELGAGCLLYLHLQNSGKEYLFQEQRHVPTIAALGLVAVLALPSEWTPYSALASVIFTLILIASTSPGCLVYRVLLQPIAQYAGRISYSLYLWHWSILCLSKWLIGDQPSAAPILLFLMGAMGSCSYFLVEQPMRLSPWFRKNQRIVVGGFAGGTLVLAGISVMALQHDKILRARHEAFELPAPAYRLPVSGLDFGEVCIVNDTDKPLRSDTVEKCTVPPARVGGQTIWALGDSHAGHLQGLLYSIHNKTGLGVHVIETPGVPFPLNEAHHASREAIFDEIMARALPGDIILVSRLFIDKFKFKPFPEIAQWAEKANLLADQLNKRNLKLVVFGPPPIFHYQDVDSCNFLFFGLNPCAEDRASLSKKIDHVIATLNKGLQGRDNAFVFNPFNHMCPETLKYCFPTKDGKFLFRDKDHLNTWGAESLTVPFLEFLEDHQLIAKSIWAGTYQKIDFRSSHLSGVAASKLGEVEAPFGRWTDGKHIVLELPQWLPSKMRMALRLDSTFTPISGTEVTVSVGGRKASFIAQELGTTVELKFEKIPHGVSTILIDIPMAKSPKELGLSNDPRELGLRLSELQILPLN